MISQAPAGPLIPGEEYRRIFEAASDGLLVYDVELELDRGCQPGCM